MSTIYFDLETAGLTPDHPDVQLAAVAIAPDWTELESFESKIVFDESKADPEALAMNHYDRAVWLHYGRPERTVVNAFTTFLNRHKTIEIISKRTGNPYSVARLAGYNAATFDGPRLQAMYKRHDAFLPAYPRCLCVLQRAEWFFQEQPGHGCPKSFKLGDVCAFLGIPLPDAHDALADVRATVQVARVLARFDARAQLATA